MTATAVAGSPVAPAKRRKTNSFSLGKTKSVAVSETVPAK